MSYLYMVKESTKRPVYFLISETNTIDLQKKLRRTIEQRHQTINAFYKFAKRGVRDVATTEEKDLEGKKASKKTKTKRRVPTHGCDKIKGSQFHRGGMAGRQNSEK